MNDIEFDLDDDTARGSARTALCLLAVSILSAACAVWMALRAGWQALSGEW
jgi:hypothetical protein